MVFLVSWNIISKFQYVTWVLMFIEEFLPAYDARVQSMRVSHVDRVLFVNGHGNCIPGKLLKRIARMN
jgi:hypothetical protein